MSPSAILLVRAAVTVSESLTTVLSISSLLRISVCARNAFLMAFPILSDLKGVIEPSLLTTLRLKRFILPIFWLSSLFRNVLELLLDIKDLNCVGIGLLILISVELFSYINLGSIVDWVMFIWFIFLN